MFFSRGVAACFSCFLFALQCPEIPYLEDLFRSRFGVLAAEHLQKIGARFGQEDRIDPITNVARRWSPYMAPRNEWRSCGSFAVTIFVDCLKPFSLAEALWLLGASLSTWI